jgi:hypothetical protein
MKTEMASSASNIGQKTDLETLMESISRLDTPALEVIAQKVSNLIAQRKVKGISKRESELVKIITSGGPSLKSQVRYKELAQKLVNEKITEQEHEELLLLIQKNEAWAVERLQFLIELSHLRNSSVAEVMEQLGIKPPQVIIPAVYHD